MLAAGAGTRVGGPKALLLVEGLPLAALHAQRRLSREADRVVLVVRPAVAEALRPLLAEAVGKGRLRLVESEEPDALGPAGSLLAAARAEAFGADDRVLVTPVDVVPASARVARTLLLALASHAAARPARGHPVAVRGTVLREAFAHAPLPLRDVLAALGDACATVHDLSGERDLDTLEDVLRLTGAPPQFLAPHPADGPA